MAYNFHFDPVDLPPECEALREEVRAFLRKEIDVRHLRAGDRPGAVLGRQGLRPQGRRARLDRHDLAEAVRRPRAHASRTLCRDRGDAGAPRPDPLLFDRRPADRGPMILRYGQPEIREKILPRIASGELCFCIGLSEPEFRLRRVRRLDPRDQDRRRLAGQRPQDLDLERAQFRLHDRAAAHLAEDQGKPPARADPVPDRLPLARASRSGRSST